MAEEELLEALVIAEDGDGDGAGDAAGGSGAAVRSCGAALKKEEEPAAEDGEDAAGEAHSAPQQHHHHTGDGGPEDGEDGRDGRAQAEVAGTLAGQTEDEEATRADPRPDPRPDPDRLNASDAEEEEDVKKARRLTPEFPEALYELLCTLQEGRRLNDQRCSFRLEGGIPRRRCHSEPNTNKPAHRVVFSSMTSLQREEFFELVATSQARRLDDQRALLGRSPPPKTKGRSFRGSIKQLSFVKKPAAAAAAPVPKEDLYNMILTTQAQGRLEDQRSRAPGPMDDEDFFSLLLRVQGGRMEEQRTELPCMLQT